MSGRRRSGPADEVGLRGSLVLGLLVGGLVLLMAPLPLQAFAVLTLVAALGAWKLSDWLARRLPEEDADRGRREW